MGTILFRQETRPRGISDGARKNLQWLQKVLLHIHVLRWSIFCTVLRFIFLVWNFSSHMKVPLMVLLIISQLPLLIKTYDALRWRRVNNIFHTVIPLNLGKIYQRFKNHVLIVFRNLKTKNRSNYWSRTQMKLKRSLEISSIRKLSRRLIYFHSFRDDIPFVGTNVVERM